MNDLDVIDLGDATVETREVGPGAYEDALVGIGRKKLG